MKKNKTKLIEPSDFVYMYISQADNNFFFFGHLVAGPQAANTDILST